MVRRGSTVRVRQRASVFLLLEPSSVGWGGYGALPECPRDVRLVDVGFVWPAVAVQEVFRVIASCGVRKVGPACKARFWRIRSDLLTPGCGRFEWRSARAGDRLPRVVWRRGAVIAAVLAVWIALTVEWGWAV